MNGLILSGKGCMTLIGVGGNPDKIHSGRQGCFFFNKNKLMLYNIEYIPDKFQITEGGSPVVTKCG
jgi:hypothetical protein